MSFLLTLIIFHTFFSVSIIELSLVLLGIRVVDIVELYLFKSAEDAQKNIKKYEK